MERLGSIDVLFEEVRVQRELQIRHFEGLDSKAGIVLGFAGVVVAIANGISFLSLIGAGFAVLAALLALWAFIPRNYPILDLYKLRERYLRAEADFTRLHLLDTQIEMSREASRLLERKARRLKVAVASLAAAAVFITAAMLGI